MIPHDCTRLVEVVSFIEKEQPAAKSGWFVDFFMRDRTTRAEKLEFRKYMKGKVKPLLYSGACLPPNMIRAPKETLTLQDMTFPVIKAETAITGCDVDERRIMPNGDIIPVGRQRFDAALNWNMMGVLDSLRATHVSEVVTLLRTGGYVLHSSDTENMGTVDFGRADALKDIDLTGTNDDWSNKCSKPIKGIESIVQEMAREKAVAGGVEVIYSPEAWEWMEAHAEREAIKIHQPSELGGSFDTELYTGYDDVEFKGTTNGGKLRHWVSNAVYNDHLGVEQLVVEPGEIMIVSKNGFDGQRVFRTVTSDNREELPQGATFFLYDDMEKEYNRKCRSFNPWIEEYHLNIAGNVNGAVVVKVVDPDADGPCVTCEECP